MDNDTEQPRAYVENKNRKIAIKSLREAADNLEIGKDEVTLNGIFIVGERGNFIITVSAVNVVPNFNSRRDIITAIIILIICGILIGIAFIGEKNAKDNNLIENINK